MNKFKKILAIGIAAVSVFASALTASAADSTISIPNTEDTHKYSVYQIMTGETSTDNVIVNAYWGKNSTKYVEGSDTKVELTDLQNIELLGESGLTDAQIIKGATINDVAVPGLKTYVDFESTPYAKDLSATNSVTVPAGYYLVKDQDVIQDSDTYSLYMIKVAAGQNLELARKIAKGRIIPDVPAKTVEGVKGTSASEGDKLKFTITCNLPNNYADYSAYKYILTDIPAAGLSIDKSTVKVVSGNDTLTPDSVTVDTNGKLVIAFNNLKTITSINADSEIVYTYTATVTDKAVYGTTGSSNSASLEYSNDPNSDDPGTSSNTDKGSVKVYTYKLVINNKNEKGEALKGSTLKLERKMDDGSYKEVTTITNDNNGTVTWDRLDAGEYKLSETGTPDGYDKLDDITFTITPEISEDGKLTKLNSSFPNATINLDGTNSSITANVTHETKTTLPVTGAIGLVALGLGAVAIGGAALIVKKKDEKDA